MTSDTQIIKSIKNVFFFQFAENYRYDLSILIFFILRNLAKQNIVAISCD